MRRSGSRGAIPHRLQQRSGAKQGRSNNKIMKKM
jgi:hypothetical protein